MHDDIFEEIYEFEIDIYWKDIDFDWRSFSLFSFRFFKEVHCSLRVMMDGLVGKYKFPCKVVSCMCFAVDHYLGLIHFVGFLI